MCVCVRVCVRVCVCVCVFEPQMCVDVYVCVLNGTRVRVCAYGDTFVSVFICFHEFSLEAQPSSRHTQAHTHSLQHHPLLHPIPHIFFHSTVRAALQTTLSARTPTHFPFASSPYPPVHLPHHPDPTPLTPCPLRYGPVELGKVVKLRAGEEFRTTCRRPLACGVMPIRALLASDDDTPCDMNTLLWRCVGACLWAYVMCV